MSSNYHTGYPPSSSLYRTVPQSPLRVQPVYVQTIIDCSSRPSSGSNDAIHLTLLLLRLLLVAHILFAVMLFLRPLVVLLVAGWRWRRVAGLGVLSGATVAHDWGCGLYCFEVVKGDM
jgi:hypothetical protein